MKYLKCFRTDDELHHMTRSLREVVVRRLKGKRGPCEGQSGALFSSGHKRHAFRLICLCMND